VECTKEQPPSTVIPLSRCGWRGGSSSNERCWVARCGSGGRNAAASAAAAAAAVFIAGVERKEILHQWHIVE